MTSQRTAGSACPGTLLAEQLSVPPVASPGLRPASADAAWRRQRDLFFVDEARKTTRATMGLGVIVHFAVFGVLFHAGYPTWRILALAGLYAGFFLSHRLIVHGTVESSK